MRPDSAERVDWCTGGRVTGVTRTYADAGRCGFALGVVLLASFVLAGRGLGASGAFAAVAGNALGALGASPTDPGLAGRIPAGVSLLDDWIVLEIFGVMLGGAFSAWLAGRWRSANTGVRSSDTALPLSRERRVFEEVPVVHQSTVVPDKQASASADPEPNVVRPPEKRHWVPAFAGTTGAGTTGAGTTGARKTGARKTDAGTTGARWTGARRTDAGVLRGLAGGALMGLGARLAYGCTSGLALSGGALMATGAWVFIPIAFGTAMMVTLLAAQRLGTAR